MGEPNQTAPSPASTLRRVFFAHFTPPLRALLEQDLRATLTPTGASLVCLHDGLTSVLEEARENLFTTARAARNEAPVHALLLGAADATEEFAVLELTDILRCQPFVLLTTDDEWVSARLNRFKWARIYAATERPRLVADLVDYLVNDFAPLPPARRILLCHLDPGVRAMLALSIARQPGTERVEFVHDSTTALLDPNQRPFFNATVKLAREGPPHLVILGASNAEAAVAVRHVRTLFNCPVLVLVSMLDPTTEQNLRMVGADEIFHAPDVAPLLDYVSAYLAKSPNAPGSE